MNQEQGPLCISKASKGNKVAGQFNNDDSNRVAKFAGRTPVNRQKVARRSHVLVLQLPQRRLFLLLV
ncbi:MAG: hypothetical protein ACKPKO_16755, partial [Candidatus Fonsibacter sp.]